MAAAGGAARRGLLKRKPNFTLQEIDILMSEVLKYEQLLFGAAASTVNAYEKQKIWWRITNKINAAGRNQRDIGEVKNRWRGLRRRAGDKISRHRQERQALPRAARAAAATGTGTGTGSSADTAAGPGAGAGWAPRAAAGLEPPLRALEGLAPHGVKEEALKEEPLELKSEGFAAPESGRARAAPERRLPRGCAPAPGESLHGWSRSPPQPAPAELSGGGDLGGQQEPLGSDFAGVAFERDVAAATAERLRDEAGGSESGRLSAAEQRLVRAHEQLAQEVRAFRREYAESRRETAAALRAIAAALAGLGSGLAHIRELCARARAGPAP